VPVLFINGTRDLSTPEPDARREAARAPRGELLVVPGNGHSVTTDSIPCVRSGLARFFRGRKVGDPCKGKDLSQPPRPKDPRSLADARPLGGLGGTLGREIGATLDTLDDAIAFAFTQLFTERVRFGGLRGGSVEATARDTVTLRLNGLVYVPGIRVTGSLTVGQRVVGRVRVSGKTTGELVLRQDGTGTSTIGGRRIDLTGGLRWLHRAERVQVGAR
jgi:hypothetical protein